MRSLLIAIYLAKETVALSAASDLYSFGPGALDVTMHLNDDGFEGPVTLPVSAARFLSTVLLHAKPYQHLDHVISLPKLSSSRMPLCRCPCRFSTESPPRSS